MKGIIFNLLQGMIEKHHGAGMWDAVLDEAKSRGIYSGIGSYPDAELMELIRISAEKLGQSPEFLTRWFGQESFPPLAQKFPELINLYTDTISFLLQINDVIHAEVKKLYADAMVPVFEYKRLADNKLKITYVSRRKLCLFAEGLIEGAARHFGQKVNIHQECCMLKGDTCCDLVCQF